MARGRFLSATVNTDRRLNALSVEAALIYLMAIPYLDRDGLMHGDPDIVQGSVCPKRRRLELDSILREWIASGLVLQYESDEGPVLWFKGFTKNQMGMHYDREAPSRFPPPPGHHREDKIGLVPDPPDEPEAPAQPTADSIPQAAEPNPDQLRTNSGPYPAEVKVEVEVKEEVEVEAEAERPPAAPAHTHPAIPPAVNVFREVHQRYPKKAQYPSLERVTDLDLWRHVCEEWRNRGFNVTNISGPLEWYDDPKRMVRQNGRPLSKGEQIEATFDEFRRLKAAGVA